MSDLGQVLRVPAVRFERVLPGTVAAQEPAGAFSSASSTVGPVYHSAAVEGSTT